MPLTGQRASTMLTTLNFQSLLTGNLVVSLSLNSYYSNSASHAVGWLALILRIKKAAGSNLDRDIGYPD
jgi:hypothetical protein